MRKALTTLALIVALTTVGCGGLNDGGDGGGGGGTTGDAGIEHPSGADELVLRWEYSGGFVPYEYDLRRIPMWSLFGDGTVVVLGPMIEIYPPPAWPGLVATRVSEEGVQAILEAAKDAGLMEGDASYDYPCIADAADSVFTTDAEGGTSVVSAYALFDAQAGSCPSVDEKARGALAAFQTKLGDLASWLPEGSIGPEEPFDVEELRVYAMPYEGDPELPQERVAWPLPTPLGEFGDEVAGQTEGMRCGVVDGSELDTLQPVAEGTNELTPWTSEGSEYRLILRPLLPDEHGC